MENNVIKLLANNSEGGISIKSGSGGINIGTSGNLVFFSGILNDPTAVVGDISIGYKNE